MKWALWQGFTVGVLAGSVALLLSTYFLGIEPEIRHIFLIMAGSATGLLLAIRGSK